MSARQTSVAGAVVIDMHELQALSRRIHDYANNADVATLLDHVGQQQEDAARRRIRETKTAPDGASWAPWSERYAKTRKRQHSLLINRGTAGGLLDALTHQPDGDTRVHVGANLPYAAVHLWGSEDEKIPARPYLDNDGDIADPRDRAELRAIMSAWLNGLLKRGMRK